MFYATSFVTLYVLRSPRTEVGPEKKAKESKIFSKKLQKKVYFGKLQPKKTTKKVHFDQLWVIEAVWFIQGKQDLFEIPVTSCVNWTESLARDRIFGKTLQDISGVALYENSCKKNLVKIKQPRKQVKKKDELYKSKSAVFLYDGVWNGGTSFL